MEQWVTTIEPHMIAIYIYFEKQLEDTLINFDCLFGGVNEIDKWTYIEFKALAKILTGIKDDIV